MVCPHHRVRLEERVSQKMGWEYVKCPMYPCLQFCAKEKALDHMREVYRQPHADVRNMWSCLLCFCRQRFHRATPKTTPDDCFWPVPRKSATFFGGPTNLWVKSTGIGCKTRKKSQITLYLPVMRMDIRCVGMTSQVHHLHHPEWDVKRMCSEIVPWPTMKSSCCEKSRNSRAVKRLWWHQHHFQIRIPLQIRTLLLIFFDL